MKLYINHLGTINCVGSSIVEASIRANDANSKSVVFLLTLHRYMSPLHNYPDTLTYFDDTDVIDDECEHSSWDGTIAEQSNCSIIDDLEGTTITNISYTFTTKTPRNVVRKLNEKVGDDVPNYILIDHLWAYISQPEYEIHSVKIDLVPTGVVRIECPPVAKGYICTVNGSPVNSIRDICDMLVGSTLTIYHMDNSITTSSIYDLFVHFARYEKPIFERHIDSKIVRWENDKWCDAEYLASSH